MKGCAPFGSTAATASPFCRPRAAEGVHDLVGPGQHVAGGVLGAVGIDDREVSRVVLGELPKPHCRAPSDWAVTEGRLEHVPLSDHIYAAQWNVF